MPTAARKPPSRRATGPAAPGGEAAPGPTAVAANEQRILDHALHSFATRGYAATGLRAIAADARLTAPMVNYYFTSKEALYQRVGAMVMQRLVSAVTAAVPDDRAIEDSLISHLLAHLAFADSDPEAVQFLLGHMYGPEEGRPTFDPTAYLALEDRVRLYFDRAIRAGDFALRPGVTRADACDLYQSLVLGCIMHDAKAMRFAKPRTDPKVASRRLRILLAGLGTAG